jgi:hypothetical protein
MHPKAPDMAMPEFSNALMSFLMTIIMLIYYTTNRTVKTWMFKEKNIVMVK